MAFLIRLFILLLKAPDILILGYHFETKQVTHQDDCLHTVNAGISSFYTTTNRTVIDRGSISGSIPLTSVSAHMVVPCRVDLTPPRSSNPPITLPGSVIHSPFQPQTSYTSRSPRNILPPFNPLTISVSNTCPRILQSVYIASLCGSNPIPLSNLDSSSSLSSHVSCVRPSMNNAWDPNRGTVGYSTIEKVPPWRHESGKCHSA